MWLVQEFQQVGVDRLGLRRGHAVRKALVGLQRAVLEQLRRQLKLAEREGFELSRLQWIL